MAEKPNEPKPGDGSLRVEVDKSYFDKLEEAANQLPDVQETLKKAEHTIVELKKAAKTVKEDHDEDDLASLVKKQVEEVIAPLKEALEKKPKDETVEQLQKAHQTIEELKASLIASKTSGGSGSGNNQDRVQPGPEPQLTEQEKILLARRGIDPKKVNL